MPEPQHNLSVRKIKETDFVKIVDYFLDADKNFLLQLGVDMGKLPQKKEWLRLLSDEYNQSVENKKLYYLIWLVDNVAVGHSNINKIIFSEEAYMHLHTWHTDKRQQGLGVEFIKLCLPRYFDSFKLKRLYCEPYALNIAPNKTLEKVGFDFIKQYETIPGWLNFYQLVNRWCMDLKKYKLLTAPEIID